MMPDKIYIFQDGDEFWYKPEDWKTPPPHRVEYIRKDALLEVIESARKAAVIQKNFNNYPAEQEVRIDVYDYIVDKIEEL